MSESEVVKTRDNVRTESLRVALRFSRLLPDQQVRELATLVDETFDTLEAELASARVEVEDLQLLEAKANARIGQLERGLTWTKTPPTKPGWYWAKQKRASGPANALPKIEAEPVEVVTNPFNAEELEVYITGSDMSADLNDFYLWAGPIEAPPLPTS
jgi:hypothetical protein